MSQTIQAVAIPDEEYEHLLSKAKMSKKVIVFDKEGRKHKFYMKGKDMWGTHEKQEYLCMPMTEALKKKEEMEARQGPSFQEVTARKMKEDFPDLSQDEIDANVDIVNEANESIKRLIQSGISPDAAYKIITGTLQSEESLDHIVRELREQAIQTVELSENGA